MIQSLVDFGAKYYISTSAVAQGGKVTDVVEDLIRAGHTKIELGIGPRPEPNARELLGRWTYEVGFSAHANCPLGVDGQLLNQERDFDAILSACGDLHIVRYSVHAPRKREVPTWEEFLAWASIKWGETMNSLVRIFSIETMYPAREPYWLDSYEEVARFLDWADYMGWPLPLVADVAHLQIGVNQGTWTEQQVEYVIKSRQVAEFHYSDNDGVNDKHRPYVAGHNARIDKWLEWARSTPHPTFVDEGRRRGR